MNNQRIRREPLFAKGKRLYRKLRTINERLDRQKMAKLNESIIHIGFHKTGSTSIQHFLKTNREQLQRYGYEFYSGQHTDQNHVELHAASMRTNRSSTFKARSEIDFDENYFRKTKQRVAEFIKQLSGRSAIFSAEGLSLLRYQDETKRLSSIIPNTVSIVAYLRNHEDYRRSHAKQLRKAGYYGVTDPESHAYMGLDSWMFDYELRLQSYKETFGPENVHIIDYDLVSGRDGSVIPSFLKLLNLEKSFDEKEWSEIILNKS